MDTTPNGALVVVITPAGFCQRADALSQGLCNLQHNAALYADYINPALGTLINALGDALGELWNLILNGVDAAIGAIETLIQQIADGLSTGYQVLRDSVGRIAANASSTTWLLLAIALGLWFAPEIASATRELLK